MASEEVEQLAVHGVRLLRGMLDGMRSAMAQMILKQPARYFPQRLMHGRNLYENVGAIPVFFNHSLKSSNLAFDSAKAVEIGGLDLRIYGHCVLAGPATWMLGFVWHAFTIPPGGYTGKSMGYKFSLPGTNGAGVYTGISPVEDDKK